MLQAIGHPLVRNGWLNFQPYRQLPEHDGLHSPCWPVIFEAKSAAVSNWHVFPVDPGSMLEETKEPLSFSELISMMNRTLAHGRHIEWALRAQKDCSRGVPGQPFDNKSARGAQSSELSGPGGSWLQPPTSQ
jgi:hypothetical protein